MKKLLLSLLCLFVCGCRYVQVELPNGNKVTYVNGFFDTKIGKMEIKAPTGETLTLENMDGSSKAMDVAAKALDKIP